MCYKYVYIHTCIVYFLYSDFSVCGYEFLCCAPFMSPADIENICSSRSTFFFTQAINWFPESVLTFCEACWGQDGDEVTWWSSDTVLCGCRENPLCSLTSVSHYQAQGHTSNRIWNQGELPPRWDWQGKIILGYLGNVYCLSLWLARMLMILCFFSCVCLSFRFLRFKKSCYLRF